MKLFALGPVEMFEDTFEIGGSQVPYFRNREFSDVVLDCMAIMKKLLNCPEGGENIMLTCSGTGGMEASVVNCFDEGDLVVAIDGGSFGHRFVQMLEMHRIPHIVVKVPEDTALTRDMIEAAVGDRRPGGLVVNIDESSTGQHYDIDMLGEYCKERGMYYIVDAISSFLADEVDMQKSHIDAVITSSQKGLSLAPGLSMVTISPGLLEKVEKVESNIMYFDFKNHIINGKRGQTPFTPSIRVILELQKTLHRIEAVGLENIIKNTAATAEAFRSGLAEIGLEYPKYPLSNAVTPVIFPDGGAKLVSEKLEEDYGFVINPSGGEKADRLFRVGHIGNHSPEDSRELLDAIGKIIERYLRS